MHYILSLDPGVTTGIAYGEWNDETETFGIKVGQAKFSHDDLYQFIHHRHDSRGFTIVCERFDYRNSYTGANLTPVEMIGVIKLYCEQNDVKLYEQAPSIQGDHAFWSNDKLKEYGIYPIGFEHGRSALKHLLYWWQFGAGFKYHQYGNFTKYIMELMPK